MKTLARDVVPLFRVALSWLVGLLLAFHCVQANAQMAIFRYLDLKKAQQWPEALEVMRKEVASPGLRTDEYLTDIRIILIGALGDVANHAKLEPGLDAEALQAYEDGLKHAARDINRTGLLHSVYARYFSDTKRNGLALPAFRRNLEFWQQQGRQIQIFLALDGIAGAYGDMGEIQLRESYRQQALEVAAGYFKETGGPTEGNEWLQYERVLKKHMDDIAHPGAKAELERLWAIRRNITERFLTPKSLSYSNAASLFAIAGEHARAAELMNEARAVFRREADSLSAHLRALLESDMMTAEGTQALYAGRHAEALEKLTQVLKYRESAKVAMDDPAIYRMLGQAHEAVGELDQAARYFRRSIDLFERTRSSYSVAERAAFFRSVSRLPYWGLIRAHARAHEMNRQGESFSAALLASETVRSRQLGELLDAHAELTPEGVSRFRQQLDADELVLAYTLMDDQFVVLAFSRDKEMSQVIPYDGKAFRELVLGVAGDLANPASATGALQERLSELGRSLIAPLQPLLVGKRKLLVLSDGIVSAIPFDLLNIDATGYRPLLADYTIRLAPSLRILHNLGRRQAESRGLLAVADPVYAKSPRVGVLSEAELRSVTRGNRFLEYFAALPETRREVQSISGLFAGQATELLVGGKAAESELKRMDLQGFGHLHFATHGILGGDVPGIEEPALVLSDETGEDGLFKASEAASLKLNASLTVLSACQTGTGEYFTGEGVMGMSRSFLAAGSRAVVVSLWSVDSLATEKLMVDFYARMKIGLSAPEALRQAKLALSGTGVEVRDAVKSAAAAKSNKAKAVSARLPSSKDADSTQYRHPFYWAAFVVFGG